ncbi:hypothetical protein P7H19_07535 [Paenibacillus larvae]|nr:hypothetical protein [Paenibacillus larvae]MDT2236177.1 hypothetical protein [Paenibacillus larvae]
MITFTMSTMTATFVRQMPYRLTKQRTVLVIKCIARIRQFAASSFPDTMRCESKEASGCISRHVWAECVEEADHLRYRRKQTDLRRAKRNHIERVSADLKEKHGMRWTTWPRPQKGHAGNACFFCYEPQKNGVTWLWKRSRPSDKFNFVFEIGITKHKELPLL